jgi:hypothetical protein
MGILEMRGSLNLENRKKGFPELPDSCPDWVVRSIYERRNNLPQSPLPIEVRNKLATATRSADTARKMKAERLLAQIEQEKNAAELEELLLKAKAISLML